MTKKLTSIILAMLMIFQGVPLDFNLRVNGKAVKIETVKAAEAAGEGRFTGSCLTYRFFAINAEMNSNISIRLTGLDSDTPECFDFYGFAFNQPAYVFYRRFDLSDIAGHNFTCLKRWSFVESSLQAWWANSQSNRYCSSPSCPELNLRKNWRVDSLYFDSNSDNLWRYSNRFNFKTRFFKSKPDFTKSAASSFKTIFTIIITSIIALTKVYYGNYSLSMRILEPFLFFPEASEEKIETVPCFIELEVKNEK